MSDECGDCREAEHSYDEHPFCPLDGSVHDLTYACQCGKKWWQYNDHFHLWKHVTEEGEWEAVRRDTELMEMERSGVPVQWVFVPLEQVEDPRFYP